jgi:hypothetical protein
VLDRIFSSPRCAPSQFRLISDGIVKTIPHLGDCQIRLVRWLAILPFVALLVGPFFVNRATPHVLGMPFLLAWLVAWILLTAAIMAVIFRLDPANRDDVQ